MARSSDTKVRIQAVARELFAAQGVRNTSLREIADRLGITKPALYYHFTSRDDLVNSIIEPMMADFEAFLTARESPEDAEPRTLLADYFDLLFGHREILMMVIREISVLAYLDLGTRMFDWRHRLMAMLIGPEPALAARVRAVVAIGGMSDCVVELADVSPRELRPLAVAAAAAALGI